MSVDASPYQASAPAGLEAPANPLRLAISNRGQTIGPWVISTDAATTEVLAKTDVDFLVFDCQHGPHDLGSVGPLLRAASVYAKPTLVRVPSAEPWMVMRALDLGAAGVIVPMVSSPAEAERARAATRYPPLGDRSYGPLRPAPGDPFDPDDGPVVLVMIETAEGLNTVDAIAGIKGIDGVFIGPVDLALALGAMPDGNMRAGLASPLLHTATAEIAAAAARNGKVLAGAVFSADHARSMAKAGMTMQVLGTDVGWLAAGAAGLTKLVEELR